MGGEGSGRPPSVETILARQKAAIPQPVPIASEIIIPNYSGVKKEALKTDPTTLGSGGATTFLDLTDTPNAYTGQGGKAVYVNVGETALEFQTAVSTDEKVKYAADDASAGYLGAKTAAGTGITLSEGTGGDADKLKISTSFDIADYVPTTRTVNGHALSANVTVTKSDLALGNVTNDQQIKYNDFPSSSVDSEIALFSSTTGKVLKRATNTGLLKASSGVIATATASTDYLDTTDITKPLNHRMSSTATQTGGEILRIAGSTLTGNASGAAFSVVNDRFYAIPIYVGNAYTLKELIINVVSAAVPNSKARLGIYTNTSDVNFYPKDLVVDGGEIDMSTIGEKRVTVNQAMTKNTMYWIVCLSGTAAPNVSGLSIGTSQIIGYTALSSTGMFSHIYHTQSYGTLPSTYPTSSPTKAGSSMPMLGFNAT